MISYKTHIDKIVAIISLQYYFSGVIIGVIFFLVLCAILMFFEKKLIYIVPIALLSTLVSQQIIIILWAQKKMEMLEGILPDFIELPIEEAIKWYKRHEALIFNDKRMVAAGIFADILAHWTGLDNFGFFFNSIYSEFFIKIGYYIAHYFMGAGLYMLIATAWMMYRISYLPLNINIILSKNIQFKGTLYSKFTICASSIYIAWGVFYMSTPAKLSSLYSMIWFSSFAFLLIAYFILPQYSIRRIIIETKKKKLENFTLRLRVKTDETLRNPTKENTACLKNLLDLQRQLDEMSEWPFGSYEVAHIALIIIIPLIVVVLEIIFDIIK